MRVCLLLLISFCSVLFAFAQRTNVPIPIQRLDGTIVVDGRVDEEGWQKIKPFQLVTHWPEFGNLPQDPTELRMAYDDEAIYVSGIMNASPENVLAASFKRDLYTSGTDYLIVMLDTFNDNENALFFGTSPTGTRSDIAFSGDAANQDVSWNTFWNAEAFQDERGWSAEMRIPFSSLGFQDRGGKVVMGMSILRYTAKKNEMYLFPAIEPQWGYWSWGKPSQLQKIEFEGIHSTNPVYVTPYVLGGTGQSSSLNATGTAYERSDVVTKTAGLDLKYNVTNNLTLDLSLNTDFAQVEADDQQINLTRFSLFFPEKRRFFLERASIFDFSFGESNRLFYSRRIGLNGSEQVDILGGVRLVGRVGDWDLGVLDVQTKREDGLPPENFGVLRIRKQIINPFSYLGGMVTSRIGDEGRYHLGYGVDGVFRLFDNDYLTFNAARTASDTSNTGGRLADAGRWNLTWERRSYTDFAYQLTYEYAGKEYLPANGFETHQDFSRYFTKLSYGWAMKGHPFLQRHKVSVSSDIYTQNADGVIETFVIKPSWEAAFTSGATLMLSLSAVHEHLKEEFSLSNDIDIAKGEYTSFDGFANYETPAGQELSGTISGRYGKYYGGRILSASLSSKWIASRYVELIGSYQYTNLEFSDRGKSLVSHIVRLRSTLALNTKLSLSAFAQYSSTAHISLMNVRFRYNPAEGTDLYLVYNEQFNSDREREIPVLPLSRARTILAKLTYTLGM